MFKVLKRLNEAQARWYVAKEALALGRGGLKAMHEFTGISHPPILRGIRDLRQKHLLGESGRLHRPGGGRKAIEASCPLLKRALGKIMEETSAGDPMSTLCWTSQSTFRIAEELTRQGNAVSQRIVRRKLSALGYSPQGNAKSKEGNAPANRDEQFRKINARSRKFIRHGNPTLSTDTRKRVRVEEFKNRGQLSDQLDIGLGVCHYPPGTSKWNLVEHRRFSSVSLNWKGEPRWL
jgi:hypothetical protein